MVAHREQRGAAALEHALTGAQGAGDAPGLLRSPSWSQRTGLGQCAGLQVRRGNCLAVKQLPPHPSGPAMGQIPYIGEMEGNSSGGITAGAHHAKAQGVAQCLPPVACHAAKRPSEQRSTKAPERAVEPPTCDAPASLSSGRDISAMEGSEGGRNSCMGAEAGARKCGRRASSHCVGVARAKDRHCTPPPCVG